MSNNRASLVQLCAVVPLSLKHQEITSIWCGWELFFAAHDDPSQPSGRLVDGMGRRPDGFRHRGLLFFAAFLTRLG